MKKVDPNRLLRLADGWDELASRLGVENPPPWWHPSLRRRAQWKAATLRVCAEYLRHEVREDQRKGRGAA